MICGQRNRKLWENKLNNIIIDGPFKISEVPRYCSVADIESNKTVISSKKLGIMAMGKLIVLYGPDGEAKKFLDQSGGGIYVKVGDKENLVKP